MLYNLEYFFSLLRISYGIDGGEALSCKLSNFLLHSKILLSDLDKSLFCFKCRRLNIPVVSCRASYERERLKITCLSCGTGKEILLPKKDSVSRVRGYSSIDSLIGK